MIDSKNGVIGLAIGDAMGVPLEFCIREKLQKNITIEMLGYGSHNVPKGTWSDDTSMTLGLIDAINKTGNIVPSDIADNFVKWAEKAEFTATGVRFDIGRTCLRAIVNYEKGINPTECGLDDEFSNGNGSLMRILPLIYYCYAKKMNNADIYKVVRDVSSITHRHEISIMGCYIYVLDPICIDDIQSRIDISINYQRLKEKSKFKIYFKKLIILFLINKVDIFCEEDDKSKMKNALIKSFKSIEDLKESDIEFFSAKCFMHYLSIYNDYVNILENEPIKIFEKIFNEYDYFKPFKSFIISKLDIIKKNLGWPLDEKETNITDIPEDLKFNLLNSFDKFIGNKNIILYNENKNEIISK